MNVSDARTRVVLDQGSSNELVFVVVVVVVFWLCNIADVL